MSNESINLIKGKYGKLPGEVKIELKKRVETIDEIDESVNEDELEIMKKELSELCLQNSLPDLSNNEEMVLSYILFPNIALKFFKSLNI